MPILDVRITTVCNNCQQVLKVTSTDPSGIIKVDSRSCNCKHNYEIDCGIDRRLEEPKAVALKPNKVKMYCNDLNEEIIIIRKQLVSLRLQRKIPCPWCVWYLGHIRRCKTCGSHTNFKNFKFNRSCPCQKSISQ
jgi:hypothetical protein